MDTIQNMTLEQLQRFIDQRLQHHLAVLWPDIFELNDGDTDPQRSLDEILTSIERNRWLPPPQAKSSQELLREDRQR
jgi:hypothetical protein